MRNQPHALGHRARRFGELYGNRYGRRRGNALIAWVLLEVRITTRMMGDNFPAAVVPPALFTGAACVHYQTSGSTTLLRVATSALLFFAFLYVFDASNQARGLEEDRINKPYRPAPAGLTTTQGLRRRFWSAMPLYTLLGWATGTLLWALLWQAVIVGLHLLSDPRFYFVVKPPAMQIGIICQTAAAWQLVAPLDRTGWTWALTTGIGYNIAMIFEDVRDMDGDRRIGRRTLPLLIGHWPVRIWFAVVLSGLPFALYILLFAPSGADVTATAVCTLVVTAMNWTVAARSLLRRNKRADRATYQLYGLAFGATLGCGLVLL
ncbi:UbiA family prenyltransferase [Streptomyces syringium]|uniref:UbiA family prenyltransferase n=1 Tax=Streptomyces syringium TaxID=76729 RepID=UPI0033B8C27A